MLIGCKPIQIFTKLNKPTIIVEKLMQFEYLAVFGDKYAFAHLIP